MSIDFDKNVDYYKVLEIGRNSDSEEIRAAYINILRNLKAHPDLGGSHEYAVKVNIAYHVLSDLNI
ncbi:MAG: DnaJ domain-containing protein, partial [bacterium]